MSNVCGKDGDCGNEEWQIKANPYRDANLSPECRVVRPGVPPLMKSTAPRTFASCISTLLVLTNRRF